MSAFFLWSVFSRIRSRIRSEHGPEKLRVRTLFTQWHDRNSSLRKIWLWELAISETTWLTLRENCPYLEFFWTFFREFRLNTEKYSVSLCIQSKCEKTRTNETPSTETFHAALASKKCISTNTFPNKLQESNHSYCQ